MPKQETFLKESAGLVTVEVVKTYDPSYAREVFNGMELAPKELLAQSLKVNETYDPDEIPFPDDPNYDDFLWEQLNEDALEDARQSPRLYSFFVVNVNNNGESEDRYVSADWPSAEAFAHAQLDEHR
jgi:hypothetical protein